MTMYCEHAILTADKRDDFTWMNYSFCGLEETHRGPHVYGREGAE